MEIINRTAKNGQPFIVRFEGGEFIATLGGKEVARQSNPGHRARNKGEVLHALGDLALPLAEGDMLRAAYDAYLLAQPRRVTRAGLVAEYQGLIDEQAAAYQRAHDREDARAMSIRESYEARIEAAAAAIAEYDAAHPRTKQMSDGVRRALEGRD